MTDDENLDSNEAEARAVESRAEAFIGVREARRSEVAEDYVELIADLIHQYGEARPVDIAERFGVRAPTVTKTQRQNPEAKLGRQNLEAKPRGKTRGKTRGQPKGPGNSY